MNIYIYIYTHTFYICICIHPWVTAFCSLIPPHRKLKSDRKALPLLADRFSTGQMFSWDVLNQERMKWMMMMMTTMMMMMIIMMMMIMMNDDKWWWMMMNDDEWWWMMMNDDEWWWMMMMMIMATMIMATMTNKTNGTFCQRIGSFSKSGTGSYH